MGSSFPTGSPRHLHRAVSSPGPRQGQRESRYAFHASRQLSDEVLRYLKRVRITPAFYQPFFRLFALRTNFENLFSKLCTLWRAKFDVARQSFETDFQVLAVSRRRPSYMASRPSDDLCFW